ncbi:putative glycosyltransferase [Sarocladium strictum]
MFKPGGITFLEGFILFCAAICIPPYVVSSWNYMIGIFIEGFGTPETSTYPYFDAHGPLPSIRSRTALAICMRNEDPAPIFDRVHAMRESLRQVNKLQHFRFLLLSDTSEPDVTKMEAEGVARLESDLSEAKRQSIMYRRRKKNTGFKAGNIKDYLDNHSQGDDFFIILDSDSVMGGDLLVRLVASMERHPEIGLLQTQFTSLPASGAFTRLLQFSLRWSLRASNLGSCWWTGDCAFYWGHNAIIRTAAFHKHCMLPVLPGKPPLGGHILSHDVMEGIFMRRAGYEVRLVPIDTESYESNPPTFLDYLRREHRWCQGNMQYWFMLTEPGIGLVGRFQVYLMLASYLAPASWALMSFAAIAKGLMAGYNDTEVDFSLKLQVAIVGFNLLPRLAGIVAIMVTSDRYGGSIRSLVSSVLEFTLMTLIRPVIAVAITSFLLELMLGKSTSWDGQNRDRLGLSWRESARALWLQTCIGCGISGLLVKSFPYLDVWSLSCFVFVVGLCLAIPFTVITASPLLGRITTRLGLFALPEEISKPPLLSMLSNQRQANSTKGHLFV